MHRRTAAVLAALALIAAVAATPALATTHGPCSYRWASAPSISTVTQQGTILIGSATLGACPAPMSGSESAAITVTLQRLVGGSWQAVGDSSTMTKGWSRITRGARQVSATATATCVPGSTYRTEANGYDVAPVEFHSASVTFVPADSGTCGYGGSD